MTPIAIEEKEGWVQLRFAEGVPMSAFMGYCAIPDGVLMVSVESQDEADAIFNGKGSIMGTKSPLLKAFTSPKDAEGTTVTFVIKDIKNLVSGEEETKETISKLAPYLLKCTTLVGRYMTKGTTANLSLAISTDDEDTADEVREQVIGWKVIAKQFLASMLPPDSACIKALKAIKTNTRDGAASVSLSVPTEVVVKFFEEFSMLLMRLEMLHSGEWEGMGE